MGFYDHHEAEKQPFVSENWISEFKISWQKWIVAENQKKFNDCVANNYKVGQLK